MWTKYQVFCNEINNRGGANAVAAAISVPNLTFKASVINAYMSRQRTPNKLTRIAFAMALNLNLNYFL